MYGFYSDAKLAKTMVFDIEPEIVIEILGNIPSEIR